MSGAESAFVKVAIRAVFSYAFPSQARKPVCTNDIISLKSTITNSFECRRSVTPPRCGCPEVPLPRNGDGLKTMKEKDLT